MKISLFLFLGGAALVCADALAQNEPCKEAGALDDHVSATECVCDQRLQNLKVTLPRGMRLVAACGLRWQPGQPIKLDQGAISLDTLTNGDFPEGLYLLAGERNFSGTVTLASQPDQPDVIFDPLWNTSKNAPAFLAVMAKGITFSEKERARLEVDARLQTHSCSEAKIDFKVRGLEVTVGGSEEETLALGTEILKLSPYRNCPATAR
jgi:hypothetical protein